MSSSRRENLLLIAWTTVGTKAAALKLARGAVEARLATCVQIEGPITSIYRWHDKLEEAEEYRLCFKYLPVRAVALSNWVQSHHPYETPEWVVTRANAVGEKYLSWARANSTSLPL